MKKVIFLSLGLIFLLQTAAFSYGPWSNTPTDMQAANNNGQFLQGADLLLRMDYTTVMTLKEIANRIIEIPTSDRPGVEFSDLIADGTVKIGNKNNTFIVTNITAFTASEGALYVACLDEKNNFTPIFAKITSDEFTVISQSQLPLTVQHQFGITGVQKNKQNLAQHTANMDAEMTIPQVARANNAFGLNLYARLKNEDGNIFYSPYSISTALDMTLAGANGNTLNQMAGVLHLTGNPHNASSKLMQNLQANKEFELNIANSLWPQEGYGFNQDFNSLMRERYGSEFTEVDYRKNREQAGMLINQWVAENTNGKIDGIVNPRMIDKETRLILVNAIYFNGPWQMPFDKESTRNAPFTLETGQEVEVPMMNRTAHYNYANLQGLQVLELPYKGEKMSMIIFLPEGQSLSQLEAGLTPQNIDRWTSQLDSEYLRVNLPRFKIESEFSLSDMLTDMGMSDAFSPNADFSGMTGKKDLFIGEVLHKAFVDVNEVGTEAAAATAVFMLRGLCLSFNADHPFLFIIRDNDSGSILFTGRVMNPLQ
ncbi:MAG: serpin family protein [Candidatus Omnitrophica bacterium]|nr:serpin family protein [Candidatus Omnitrophota bacterium]